MKKKILGISLFFSLIFLLAAIFPPCLFSVEESFEVGYKKARCPRCGMEFYYTPGKDSPHSHWVHYEIEDGAEEADGNEDILAAAGITKTGVKEEKAKKTEARAEGRLRAVTRIRLGGATDLFEEKCYELRQKLTCPYDGYSFFPEGDIIEDTKLMQETLAKEEMSIIESSFAKSISFGVSKDLRQFGYDLFVVPEKYKEDAEDAEKRAEGLSAFGNILKTGFNPMALLSPSPSFSSQSSSHTAVVPVGPEYIIGPGDTLVINIWGSVQESFPVEIDREGKIMLPKAGPLYLWGLKFQDAENIIKERLDQFYTNFNVDVSMGKLRSIQVFVMGEVKKPGSYVLDSQSNIFQALYAAGGPTKLGTLRKIKLMHASGDEKKVDLYPFLLEGSEIEQSRIQSGDTIFVPAIGDVVAVAGNVKRPGIYETKSEIPLVDLLSFSGGITPTGDLERLQVERIMDNERRIMLDIELEDVDVGKLSLDDISMRNGDMVIVSPIVRLKHDFVSVLGNVERPGDYALRRDMRISDLIKRAKGFLPGTYLARAEIARVTKDRTRQIIPVNLNTMTLGQEKEDISLNEWDILLVYSEAEIQPPVFVEIDGAVNRPGEYELTPGMKVSDLIFKAGGVKPKDVIRGAELFHIMPGEKPVVRKIAVKRVSPTSITVDKDIILRAGDGLFIKSEPKLTERRIVTVKGEVRYPGTYSIREGERLSSLIERAGNFTEDAFLEGAVFSKKSIREAQEKIRGRFLEKEGRGLREEQQAFLLKGPDSGIGATGTTGESLEARRRMLELIAMAEMQGRMVIKLLPVSELKGSKHDILLADGDILTVPETPLVVTVMGSVNNPTSVPFEKGRGPDYYIRKTGGTTRHADRNEMYIIRANGEAVNRFMMSKTIQRGDSIVVPQRVQYLKPPSKIFNDTVEMISRLAISVGIIAALN